jgi:hypothetical protein
MKQRNWLRGAAAGLGAALLLGVGAAAVAEDQYGENEIDITVQVDQPSTAGLYLTVDGTQTALTENGSTGTVRQFTGTLPTVTVTDTRDPADVPDGAWWYVLGSSSNFVGDATQPDITAGHLGWTPRVISADPSEVDAGPQVDTVLDDPPNNVGLAGQELFAMASDSQTINPTGQWTATADLFLRTPLTVAPGNYSATLTLSLFE